MYPGAPCIRIRLVASDHNYLIAKLRLPEWRCVIITGRAPHSARPQAEAEGFWNTISSVLRRKAGGWPIQFRGDANAHVGECVTSAIGPLYPSQENQAGALFHDWLLGHHLFAPATFEKWHQGQQHATFVSPGGDNAVRIDYIAFPQDINFHTLNSWVETAIDLGISRADHFAVLCRCLFSVTFSTASTQRHQRHGSTRWDSHHLSQQLQCEATLNQIHSSLQPQTSQVLHQVTRPKKTWRRKSHIADSTWTLVNEKKHLFKQLRQLKRTKFFTVLHAAFHAWRQPSHGHVLDHLLRGLPAWLKLHDHAAASTSAQLRQVSLSVGKLIRQEDVLYSQSLADSSATTYSVEGLAGIWKHFRALLPKNGGKCNQIQQDLESSLLQHFQTLEAGRSTSQHRLRVDCIRRNNQEVAKRPAIHYLDLAELPTLSEIEDHCLRQRPHKAPGPECVPSTLSRWSCGNCTCFTFHGL